VTNRSVPISNRASFAAFASHFAFLAGQKALLSKLGLYRQASTFDTLSYPISMPIPGIKSFLLPFFLLCLILPAASYTAPQTQNPSDPHSVPSLDGGIGPCTADFLITDSANAPVYNAAIKVRIAYGTWSIRKLDLQVNTNIDGKARFTGLPDHLKHGLLFQASEGDRTGEAFDDPSNTCKAQFTITIRKPLTP
jgi:hypothetical protein